VGAESARQKRKDTTMKNEINDNPYGSYSPESDAEYAYYERMNDFPPSQWEVNQERYAAQLRDMQLEGDYDDGPEEFGPFRPYLVALAAAQAEMAADRDDLPF
jgi:hypothetical protein